MLYIAAHELEAQGEFYGRGAALPHIDEADLAINMCRKAPKCDAMLHLAAMRCDELLEETHQRTSRRTATCATA